MLKGTEAKRSEELRAWKAAQSRQKFRREQTVRGNRKRQ